MLALLTDAHLSPNVAEQIKAKRPEIDIYSLRDWRDGVLLQAEDDVILAAALEEGRRLVTYDQRTIAPLIVQWNGSGRDHAGVIFINRQSIGQAAVGAQARAPITLWEEAHTQDWTNSVTFLKSGP